MKPTKGQYQRHGLKETISVKLTPGDGERLRQAATAAGVSTSVLVRKLLLTGVDNLAVYSR